jgi:flagellin
MALGVLNNLSAIYAENNLNNTNNSLQTVLQQLSSGSKINSGADDAAGLSLVNGLGANSSALTQSETNATEGVGLLQVADGALSQVTSLLNRAITLATEASNKTLNSTQEGAANQEYQSILSEINNIGQTTTYNQQQVFNGQQVAIYTGDSSAAGSSIDLLKIRTLSEASMGDTGGAMAYSDGSNSVFINLSNTDPSTGAVTNAQDTDTLNANGTTTINVNYLVKGANGTESSATTSISAGKGTSFSNTANGLISAINSAGLGLTASFTTQAQAGLSGGGSQTGIQISGGVISVGQEPSTVATSATLSSPDMTPGTNLAVGQTFTVMTGTTVAASIAITSPNTTLADLAASIIAGTGGNGGVVANVVNNSDGTQSLSLNETGAPSGALSVVTSGVITATNSLSVGTTVSDVPLGFTAGGSSQGVPGSTASVVLGMGTVAESQGSDALTGTLVMSNSLSTATTPSNVTFVMGQAKAGTSSDGNTISLASGHSTLADLETAISGSTNLGATATLGANGLTITSNTAGTTLEQGAGTNLGATPSVGVVVNVNGAAPTSGAPGSATISMLNGPGFSGGDTLVNNGTIVISNSTAGAQPLNYTFTVNAAAGAGTNLGTGVGTDTVTDLANAISGSGLGVTANVAGGLIVLTSNTVGTTVAVASGNTLDDQFTESLGNTNLPAVNPSAPANVDSAGAVVGTDVAAINGNQVTGTGDTLGGTIVLSNNGHTDTFVMNSNAANVYTNATHNTINVNATTLASLKAAINGETVDGAHATASLGVVAALNSDGTGLTFTPTATGTSIVVNSSLLTDASTMDFTNPVSGSSTQKASGVISLTDGGQITSNTTGTLSGTVVITNNSTITDTFVMGQNSATSSYGANGGTFSLTGSKISDLVTAINTLGNDATHAVADLGATASADVASGGVFLQSTSNGAIGLNAVTTKLTFKPTEQSANGSNGVVTAAANVTFGNGSGSTTSGSDNVLGTTLVLSNTSFSGTVYGSAGAAVSIVVGGNPASDDTTDIYLASSDNTLSDLAEAINTTAATLAGDLHLSATVNSNGSGLLITSTDTTSSLVDTGSVFTDNYTGSETNSVPGTGATSATFAEATVGTLGGQIGGSDVLAGTLVLSNGGVKDSFAMGGTAGNNGAGLYQTGDTTLDSLRAAINSAAALGLKATIANGQLDLQATATDTTIAVGSGSNLTDTASESILNSNTGITPSASSTTLDFANALTTGDYLQGTIAITANTITHIYVMGNTTLQAGQFSGGSTIGSLQAALLQDKALGVTASITGGTNKSLTLASATGDMNPVSAVYTNLQDAGATATASTSSLGTFASLGDQVSGTVAYTIPGFNSLPQSIALSDGDTVQGMINQINTGNAATVTGPLVDPYGVHATGTAVSGGYSVTLTSDVYGPTGDIINPATSVTDDTTTAVLNYVPGDAYNVGLSNTTSSLTALYDSSTNQANPASLISTAATMYNNFTTDSGGSGGVATISYSDGAGEALNGSDLSNQSDAEGALNDLNLAISDVASQDGYIGAQINTLDSISQVMSTQQENVVSAQNAIQATDYASATSNMSKYEILSQTGIAALAQANTVQQEVTKLLQ